MMPHAGKLRVPLGFRFAALAAGIKKNAQLDLALAAVAPGATAAALFTRNRVVAAPVAAGRECLRAGRGRIRAVVVNSGNANCATGGHGLRACRQVCAVVGKALGADVRGVFPSSTGVIGVRLPVEKITAACGLLVASLEGSPGALMGFARAIMTTDTRPKVACERFRSRGRWLTVTGVAKGAGMIHPDLATMLVYIFTDAAVPAAALKSDLRAACAQTLNSISVDGDTSTNDTVLVVASGAAGKLAGAGARRAFRAALERVCASLAAQIVSDGEGVQHVVRLRVEGARSPREARRVANAIATSALVKTALAGADPNWGRMLAAAGRSGAAIDPGRVDVWFGRQAVCRRGAAVDFDEAEAHALLSQPEYEIKVALGRGRGRCTLLTTDLTAEYVRINADYRS